MCSVVCSFRGVFHRVHSVQAVRSCSLSLGVFRPFALPFVRFPALLAVSLANMALFRILRGFLARFGVRMYACIG